MPAYQGLEHYQPALVLLLGLATFAGVLGTGLATLRALRLGLPSPWREVAAALLGTGLLGLGVQLLAMLALATRTALLVLWGAFALAGSIGLATSVRRSGARPSVPSGRGVALLAGIWAVAAGINLLLAMAPLTKIDEIFYQLLPPARIVLDRALVFYVRPWEAAILPQMGYPIAGAPLHALGFVDAASVWSWCFGALLAWFVARLVHGQSGSAFAAALGAGSVAVGLYPSVYHTTGGPHALGDLALAAAVLALAFRAELLRACSPTAWCALLSICTSMAAVTKLSLLPISGIAIALGLVQTLREAPCERLRVLAAAAVPWLAFYVPLCVWTLFHSGSPFGPMLADVFAPSVFDEGVRAEIAGSARVGQTGLLVAIEGYLVHYPLAFPLTLLAALVLPAAMPAQRRVVLSLFVIQLAIIAILLPHISRFLAGLHHAVLVVGLIQLQRALGPRLERAGIPVAAAVALLVPWLGVQAYRAWPLVPIALGIGDREAYYRSYIPLYDDLRALDEILPRDAVLFARNRLGSIYFPRPVYMHHRDLPAGRRAFALLGTSERPIEAYDCAYLRLPNHCRLGEPVYTNPAARYVVLRTPGESAQTNRLEVREVLAGGQ